MYSIGANKHAAYITCATPSIITCEGPFKGCAFLGSCERRFRSELALLLAESEEGLVDLAKSDYALR